MYDKNQVIAIRWGDNDFNEPVLGALRLMFTHGVPQNKHAIIEAFRYLVYAMDQLRDAELGREPNHPKEFYTDDYFLLREEDIAIGDEADAALQNWGCVIYYDNRLGNEFWHVDV
jgi:hypothetical protein